MLTITEFAEKIGITRFDADNWRKRIELRTEYKPTIPGRAQEYSHDNVLELAIIAPLVQSGMPPRSAVAIADMVIRNSRAGGLREWLLFPAGDVPRGIGSDQPTTEALEQVSAQSATGAVIAIPARKIVQKVNELFAVGV